MFFAKILFVVSAVTHVAHSEYKALEGNCLENELHGDPILGDRLNCEVKCDADADCLGYSYSPKTKECFLKSDTCQEPVAGPFIFYEKISDPKPEPEPTEPEDVDTTPPVITSPTACISRPANEPSKYPSECAKWPRGFVYKNGKCGATTNCVAGEYRIMTDCVAACGTEKVPDHDPESKYQRLLGDCLSKYDYFKGVNSSLANCEILCDKDPRCRGFSYNFNLRQGRNCRLRNATCSTPIDRGDWLFYMEYKEEPVAKYTKLGGDCKSGFIKRATGDVSACEILCDVSPKCRGFSYDANVETYQCVLRNSTCTHPDYNLQSVFYVKPKTEETISTSTAKPIATRYTKLDGDCMGGHLTRETVDVASCEKLCDYNSECRGFSYNPNALVKQCWLKSKPCTYPEETLNWSFYAQPRDLQIVSSSTTKSMDTSTVTSTTEVFIFPTAKPIPKYTKLDGNCYDKPIAKETTADVATCETLCNENSACRGFSYNSNKSKRNCWLKSEKCTNPVRKGNKKWTFYEQQTQQENSNIQSSGIYPDYRN